MAGGGWISPPDFLSFYGPNFPPNQSKHGLKWNFASLHTFRNFEKIPRFCSFAVGLHQSELVWKFPIWPDNFQKFTIFIYIDNIYIKWKLKTFYIHIWHKKMPFVMKKFEKNKFFKIFVSFLTAIFFSKREFFEKFIIQPPIFMIVTCFLHEKKNLHEG